MGAIAGSDWIFSTLHNDETLADLISGVFMDDAPIGSEHPFVRINFVDGNALKNNEAIIWFDELYDVVGVDQSESYVTLMTIADRILELLDNAKEQNIGAGLMIGCSVENKISYSEKNDGKEYKFLGYSFRVYAR